MAATATAHAPATRSNERGKPPAPGGGSVSEFSVFGSIVSFLRPAYDARRPAHNLLCGARLAAVAAQAEVLQSDGRFGDARVLEAALVRGQKVASRDDADDGPLGLARDDAQSADTRVDHLV